jgi:hypothetical protein
MSSHVDRHGRQFEKSNRSDPRIFRGHQRPGFFSGDPDHHRFGGHRQQSETTKRDTLVGRDRNHNGCSDRRRLGRLKEIRRQGSTGK